MVRLGKLARDSLQEQTNGGGWGTIQSSGATSAAVGGKGNASHGYHVQAALGVVSCIAT